MTKEQLEAFTDDQLYHQFKTNPVSGREHMTAAIYSRLQNIVFEREAYSFLAGQVTQRLESLLASKQKFLMLTFEEFPQLKNPEYAPILTKLSENITRRGFAFEIHIDFIRISWE